MKKRIVGLLICSLMIFSACASNTETEVLSKEVESKQEEAEAVSEKEKENTEEAESETDSEVSKIRTEEAETVAGIEIKTEDIEYYSSSTEELKVMHTTWVTGSHHYSMPYDKERFVFESQDGIDSFVSIDKNANGDALVSVKIYKNKDNADKLIKQIIHIEDSEVTREEKEMASHEITELLSFEEETTYKDYYIYKNEDYNLVVEMCSDQETFGEIGMNMLMCVYSLEFDE